MTDWELEAENARLRAELEALKRGTHTHVCEATARERDHARAERDEAIKLLLRLQAMIGAVDPADDDAKVDEPAAP